MIGFQEYSLKFGRDATPNKTNTSPGLSVMDQSMLSGLKISIQYWMITEFLH